MGDLKMVKYPEGVEVIDMTEEGIKRRQEIKEKNANTCLCPYCSSYMYKVDGKLLCSNDCELKEKLKEGNVY